MMRAALIWAALALSAATCVHLVTLHAYPGRVMAETMARMSQSGARMNQWIHRPRVTEASRGVVRPSPDLAYSTCVFDLGAGPLAITVEPWGDYMSLSLYAANTDNFYTLNDRAMPDSGARVIVHSPSQTVDPAARAGAHAVVESPSPRGVALLRRLAPTAARFADADAARGVETCSPLEAP